MNPKKLYPGRRRTHATRYIWEAADRVYRAGVTVDVNSSMGTVAINAPGSDGVFMQGDEGYEFWEQCRALWHKYPSLPSDVCEYARAEPYCDLL